MEHTKLLPTPVILNTNTQWNIPNCCPHLSYWILILNETYRTAAHNCHIDLLSIQADWYWLVHLQEQWIYLAALPSSTQTRSVLVTFGVLPMIHRWTATRCCLSYELRIADVWCPVDSKVVLVSPSLSHLHLATGHHRLFLTIWDEKQSWFQPNQRCQTMVDSSRRERQQELYNIKNNIFLLHDWVEGVWFLIVINWPTD